MRIIRLIIIITTFFASGLQRRPGAFSQVNCLGSLGQVKVTRMILALIRKRWAISWVPSTWVKQFYRCLLAKVIPALCYWISPWSAGVEMLKASWDAWIKLGRFPIVLRIFFGVYNWILRVVLQFHDTMGLLFARLEIGLRCTLSWSFVFRLRQTKSQGNYRVSDSQLFYLFVRFDLISCFVFLSPDSSRNYWMLHLFCSWVESLTSKISFPVMFFMSIV